MSTLKVNGEHSGDRPFTQKDPPRHEDAYGISKREAEQKLHPVEHTSRTRQHLALLADEEVKLRIQPCTE